MLVVVYLFSAGLADDLKPQRLQSNLSSVQPMTGIALWTTSEAVSTAPIQLEYAYLKYSQIVQESGVYDWEPVERLLSEVAARKHQAILRWHDTYHRMRSAGSWPEYRLRSRPAVIWAMIG